MIVGLSEGTVSVVNKCEVLILGASGMLGHTVLRYFNSRGEFRTIGTVRSHFINPEYLDPGCELVGGVDAENIDSLTELLNTYKPTIVINCVGLVKQLAESNDPLICMPINSLLPHRLSNLCQKIDARFVHISTDCVFDGRDGMYLESDWPNPRDLYGRTKLLGEVQNFNTVTLRTSIIGHEVGSSHSLLEWFLSQSNSVEGFSKAVFSGLPTVELARVIHDYVIPFTSINGLYHVSSFPISKFELLNLIAQEYSKSIAINVNNSIVVDRSLDSSKFQRATGFRPKSWKAMLRIMREFG